MGSQAPDETYALSRREGHAMAERAAEAVSWSGADAQGSGRKWLHRFLPLIKQTCCGTPAPGRLSPCGIPDLPELPSAKKADCDGLRLRPSRAAQAGEPGGD